MSFHSAIAATYYVSASGTDTANGRSPARAWRTLARVNAAELKPGDTVLFRRGDEWRGSLRSHSGAEGSPVTYGAYGTGAKPTFVGSISRNAPADWRDEGGSLWSTGGSDATKAETLPPVDEIEKAIKWGLHTEGGAKATFTPLPEAASPTGLRIECAQGGKAGNEMQLITAGLHLQQDKCYRLAVRVRCTQPVILTMPTLMRAEAPWGSYSSGPATLSRRLDAQWIVIAQYYRATVTSDNARLTFYLGAMLPAGATFEMDRSNFAECAPSAIPSEGPLPVDVGNIIFGNEASCGIKHWKKDDLRSQGDYWYDFVDRKLYVYSDQNPAVRYKKVECALHQTIINQGGCSWVIYENLALKYGAAHGIGGGSTQHITVRDCDFSWIGGADQYGGGRTVRFGNGIEFWGDAHDNLVERCRLWEIYDAALTNQNGGATARQYNITYRNNIIWNSEYSFEYWNRPEVSETYNIRFVNNTCLNAGHGWAHAQRPDPSGRHLCFYDSSAQAHDIVVANNIFYEAATNALYAPGWSPAAIAALQIDHNLWFQQNGTMMSVSGKSYPMSAFAQYQTEHGKEAHSIVGDPRLVAPDKRSFHLTAASPCIDAGMDVGASRDFDGTPVPQGARPDIGAYEFK